MTDRKVKCVECHNLVESWYEMPKGNICRSCLTHEQLHQAIVEHEQLHGAAREV